MCFKIHGNSNFMAILNQTYESFKNINNTVYIFGLCAIAIIIRALGVDSMNLSIEEAEFLYYSHPSISMNELLLLCKRGLPIFDFVFYRAWFTIVGFGILKAKALSFLFNIMLIPTVYALAKKINQEEIQARFSAFLVVILLSFISLANVPRFYNEVLLCSTLSFYFFLDFFSKARMSYWQVFFYVLTTSLAILFHYFFVFIVITQGITLLLFYFKKQIGRTPFLIACLSFVCIALIIGVVMSSFMYLAKSGNEYLSESNNPFIFFAHLYIFLGQDPLLFVACLGLIIFYVVFLFKKKRQLHVYQTIIVLWFLLTLIIPHIVDICYKPIIRRDYHYIVLIPFLVMVSWGFSLLNQKWKVLLVELLILSGIINICFIQNYYTNPENTLYKTPYRFGDLSNKLLQHHILPNAWIYTDNETPYNLYFRHIWHTKYKATSDTSTIHFETDSIIYVIKHKDMIILGDEKIDAKINTNRYISDTARVRFDAFYVYKTNPK